MKYLSNPPDAASLMTSARSFGNYDLSSALADLIDNSIKARARNIDIRCVRQADGPKVRILDDGTGMSADELHRAMRPASTNPDDERAPDDLGRFGWGMIDNGHATLNWAQIWNTQAVPAELQHFIVELAPQIAAAIRRTPSSIRNVGEYCKFEICWQTLKAEEFAVPALPDFLMLDVDEAKEERKDARTTAKMDAELDIDVQLPAIAPKAEIIRRTVERKGLLSPKSDAGLRKLAMMNFNLARPEKNALKLLLNRMAEEGMPWQEL